MKIDDIRKDLEKSKKYEEDLDRITARLKEISKQKSGRISTEEARELVAHIKRLRLLEGYHRIESSMLSEARKEYFREGRSDERARAVVHAIGFEEGVRKVRPDARWILFRYKRLLEDHKAPVAHGMIAKEFNFNSGEAAKQFIKRARKDHPDIFKKKPS